MAALPSYFYQQDRCRNVGHTYRVKNSYLIIDLSYSIAISPSNEWTDVNFAYNDNLIITILNYIDLSNYNVNKFEIYKTWLPN